MSAGYRNLMEDVVEDVVRQYLGADPSICRCEFCHVDIVALALNQLPPHYSASSQGVQSLDAKREQLAFASEAVRVVKVAVDKVRRSPRHETPSRAPATAAAVPKPVRGSGTARGYRPSRGGGTPKH